MDKPFQVSRLQEIREDEQEMRGVFTETLQRQDPEPQDTRQEPQSEALLEQGVGGDS